MHILHFVKTDHNRSLLFIVVTTLTSWSETKIFRDYNDYNRFSHQVLEGIVWSIKEVMFFLIGNVSFQNSLSVTFTWTELQMSRCCLIHTSIIIIIPRYHTYIYNNMSRLRTIYVVPMWSIFHFNHRLAIINLMNTDTLSYF